MRGRKPKPPEISDEAIDEDALEEFLPPLEPDDGSEDGDFAVDVDEEYTADVDEELFNKD